MNDCFLASVLIFGLGLAGLIVAERDRTALGSTIMAVAGVISMTVCIVVWAVAPAIGG